MNTLEVGRKLVELCKTGQFEKAAESLYSPDIVSVEAMAMPDMPAEIRGLEGVKAKGTWWAENHIVHSAVCEGPFPKGDQFAVIFKFDVTHKPSDRRYKMEEVALYTVKNDKIVREEFFYATE